MFLLLPKIVECAFSHPQSFSKRHKYGISFSCRKHFNDMPDEKTLYHPMEDKLHQKGLKHILNRIERVQNGMTNITFKNDYNQFKCNQYFVICLIT